MAWKKRWCMSVSNESHEIRTRLAEPNYQNASVVSREHESGCRHGSWTVDAQPLISRHHTKHGARRDRDQGEREKEGNCEKMKGRRGREQKGTYKHGYCAHSTAQLYKSTRHQAPLHLLQWLIGMLPHAQLQHSDSLCVFYSRQT